MQVQTLAKLRHSPSTSQSPEPVPLSSRQPPATTPTIPGGLQAQLATVKLRHQSVSPTGHAQSLSSAGPTTAIAASAQQSVAPQRPSPPPPPPPPPRSRPASPERLNRSSAAPQAASNPLSLSRVTVAESYRGVPSAMSSVQHASSLSGLLSTSPTFRLVPPPPPPPPGAQQSNPNRSTTLQPRTTTQAAENNVVQATTVQASSQRMQTSTGVVLDQGSIDSKGNFARQVSSAWSPSPAVAAGQQQWQVQQPALQSAGKLQLVAQSAALQQDSSQQQARQAQADHGDTSTSIGAAYAQVPQLTSVGGGTRLEQLQAGFKKGWPTVQTNPLYQKAEVAAGLSNAASLPSTGMRSVCNASIRANCEFAFRFVTYMPAKWAHLCSFAFSYNGMFISALVSKRPETDNWLQPHP